MLKPLKIAMLLTYLAILTISLTIANQAQAGVPVFFSFGGEATQTLVDLPDNDRLKINEDFIDIGVIYKEVYIFFIPVWQYDLRLVATIPNDGGYYEMSQEEINGLASASQIKVPQLEDVSLDFWTAWGGKIVILLIGTIFYLGRRVDLTKSS